MFIQNVNNYNSLKYLRILLNSFAVFRLSLRNIRTPFSACHVYQPMTFSHRYQCSLANRALQSGQRLQRAAAQKRNAGRLAARCASQLQQLLRLRRVVDTTGAECRCSAGRSDQRTAGRITPEEVRGLEFYMYDKKAGPFSLEIDSIEGVRASA